MTYSNLNLNLLGKRVGVTLMHCIYKMENTSDRPALLIVYVFPTKNWLNCLVNFYDAINESQYKKPPVLRLNMLLLASKVRIGRTVPALVCLCWVAAAEFCFYDCNYCLD